MKISKKYIDGMNPHNDYFVKNNKKPNEHFKKIVEMALQNCLEKELANYDNITDADFTVHIHMQEPVSYEINITRWVEDYSEGDK